MELFAELLIWSLGVFGITNIVVVSSLFKPIRQFLRFSKSWKDNAGQHYVDRKFPIGSLGRLISCPMCLSFWVGILASIFVYSPSHSFLFQSIRYNEWAGLVFDGAIGSCTSWMLYLLIADKQFKH